MKKARFLDKHLINQRLAIQSLLSGTLHHLKTHLKTIRLLAKEQLLDTTSNAKTTEPHPSLTFHSSNLPRTVHMTISPVVVRIEDIRIFLARSTNFVFFAVPVATDLPRFLDTLWIATAAAHGSCLLLKVTDGGWLSW